MAATIHPESECDLCYIHLHANPHHDGQQPEVYINEHCGHAWCGGCHSQVHPQTRQCPIAFCAQPFAFRRVYLSHDTTGIDISGAELILGDVDAVFCAGALMQLYMVKGWYRVGLDGVEWTLGLWQDWLDRQATQPYWSLLQNGINIVRWTH